MTCRNKPGWIFCETEQPKFSDLPAHFAAGVAAEDAIREVEQPKSAAFTVVDVERSGPIVMAPDDDRSGAFYIYDRKRGRFWLLDLADGVFGGYSRREMRRKIDEFRLLGFAENPARLVPARHS